MSASTGDKITDTRNAARPNSARATGTRSAGGSSLACDSLAGWPTASKVHFVTYQIDSNSDPVTGTQLDCYGIVSGNSITSFTVVDGSDTGNSVGDVVEMLPTAAWGQDLADALTSTHNRSGGLKSGLTITSPTLVTPTVDTLTVTSGTTLPAGDIGTADIAAGAITQAKLNTATGELGGVWQSYTPTLANITLGNGTVTGTYSQIGKTVTVTIKFVMGSTTVMGTNPTLSIPVTANAKYATSHMVGTLYMEDLATAAYFGFVELNNTSAVTPRSAFISGTKLADAGFSATTPFTWGTGDYFTMTVTYEAA